MDKAEQLGVPQPCPRRAWSGFCSRMVPWQFPCRRIPTLPEDVRQVAPLVGELYPLSKESPLLFRELE